MERVIFGDNQFFGINHMSEEKAATQLQRFRDTDEIIKVIDAAYESEIRGFMFTTHAKVEQICNVFRSNPAKYHDLRLYPVMPYAHKYAKAVTEKGILGAAKDALVEGSSSRGMASAFVNSSLGLLLQDPFRLMRVLVDTEMKMFRGLTVEVIFLQNIVTDLLLGLRLKEAFVSFTEYIQKAYAAEAGFITMNLPALADFLDECGLENPTICASVNKIGYLMNPSREAYETAIETRQFRLVAMSVLASGAIPPREAVQYVIRNLGIESIVFGASSKAHIASTRALIDEYSASL